MEASHQEVENLRKQMDSLNVKFDTISVSIMNVSNLLSEQKGANLPTRMIELEARATKMETIQAGREGQADTIREHTQAIKDLTAFMYKMSGVVIFLNAIFIVVGKLLLDRIVPTP
jgi:hypothetical protein